MGWDATLNGNLAELLQEPTLMGALEGAGITVLSKGVRFPNGSNPFGADTFPTGTLLLQNSTSTTRGCGSTSSSSTTPFPSSFWCNPSSIDGLCVTNSSQGGGGIFVHAWGHNLQIANDRVTNNSGTLSGGINIGQGEHPDAYMGGFGTVNADPGSCETSILPNVQLPYCFNENVNIHHNSITLNSSTGDELFSATPAGAGGVTMCTGSDYYKFNYNWLCGNLSSGDGGGFGHVGFTKNGDIEHNSILFNQSTNPTIATNGGGLLIMGAPDSDPTCGGTTDVDCIDATVTPSDGIGPGLTINANLIMGNSADSGSGGGIRFQSVNGMDMVNAPLVPLLWYSVNVTNNIIADNVAGWDGAGISLIDSVKVNIVNNTIASNDTTASSGVLFNTLGAPLASSSGPTCTANCGTASAPQPAGVVSIPHSSILLANLPSTVICPTGHPNCKAVSVPVLYNDIIWQNRSFQIGVGSLGNGTLNQQNIVTLYNAALPFTSSTVHGTSVASQATTGQCVAGSQYWDVGVRGDTGPANHTSGVTLAPAQSVLVNGATLYSGLTLHNSSTNPLLVSQYCNGSRVPPENGGAGWQVPPGISDATVPNPVFNLSPAATVDEGNNWVNLNWGPLSEVRPSTESNPATETLLGNYAIATTSPATNYVTPLAVAVENLVLLGAGGSVPTTDFFGHTRPNTLLNAIDVGAVEAR